jgi:hypothetical protein
MNDIHFRFNFFITDTLVVPDTLIDPIVSTHTTVDECPERPRHQHYFPFFSESFRPFVKFPVTHKLSTLWIVILPYALCPHKSDNISYFLLLLSITGSAMLNLSQFYQHSKENEDHARAVDKVHAVNIRLIFQ